MEARIILAMGSTVDPATLKELEDTLTTANDALEAAVIKETPPK